jgi:hypothetical protein
MVGEAVGTICAATPTPALVSTKMCRETGCVLAQQTPKKKLWSRKSHNHTYTPFFTNNTFFQHLHTLPTHFQHLCRETRPCSSVEHAQTMAMAFASTKGSKEQVGVDKKET